MKKLSVCILFGGMSPEHEVSLRSAESVLNNIDKSKYDVFPVGITKEGEWILFGGDDYSLLPAGTWMDHPEDRSAAISPVRGQGLLIFGEDGMKKQMNALSSLGLLSRFVGMLTDSRSFLSYPRHEYFRRILCNLLGEDLQNGKLPKSEMGFIHQMVKDISYNNADRYFNF